MPSAITVRNNYRKAKCCATCAREKNLLCNITGMRVRPEMLCDNHAEDARKASRRVTCTRCAFGPAGDHSCTVGCGKDVGRGSGCYAGRKMQ